MQSTRVGITPPHHRLSPSTRLGRVSLQVADLSRSIAYYTKVLDLQQSEGTNGRATLTAVGENIPLLELVERKGARPVPRRGLLGLFHFAILLPDRSALGAFLRHISHLNIPVGMSDHHVSEAIYLSDPDGLGIEVYADRPRDQWRISEGEIQMTTEHLDVDALMRHSSGRTWEGMPRGTRMGHVHLHVGDLDRAATLYHETIGFDKVVWSYPGALFLSAGGYHHHLGVNTWASRSPSAGPDDARLRYWTIVMPDQAELAATVDNLQSAGVETRQAESDVLVDDPWGTTLRLSVED